MVNRISRTWPILLILAAATGVFAAAAPRPNIIVIMADDLGYSDLGCYGGEIKTPNLDRLAANGLRFTNFYNASRCCPTRASMMTGLYPHQAGVGRMTFDAGPPGYKGTLGQDTVTIPEVLREAGYRTAMVGKWHLTITEDSPDAKLWASHRLDLGPFGDEKTYPVGRGFEEHYGTIWGVVNYYDPFSLVHNTEPIKSVPEGYYYTDAINDHAVKMIDKYAAGDEPLFLYVAHTAPHWPVQAPPQDIARYRETYAAGWDAIREGRYKRMVEMGLIDADKAVLTPRMDAEQTWAENPTKAHDIEAMATHAAMIDIMDRGIGRIISKLEQMNELNNTIIFFLSDNGASPEEYPKAGFDRPSHTRDGREIAHADKTRMPGPEDVFGFIGPMWANAANTPYRYWKKESYEGGICTPLIVHWPAGLKTKPGSITRQTGHVIDLMPTCLELAGAEYPKQYKSRDIKPMVGVSLAASFQGERLQPGRPIFFEHYGGRAMRQGDWKIVSLANRPWEIYNLAADRTEMRNLAAEQPQRLEQMTNMWDQWAASANVLPRPGRN